MFSDFLSFPKLGSHYFISEFHNITFCISLIFPWLRDIQYLREKEFPLKLAKFFLKTSSNSF